MGVIDWTGLVAAWTALLSPITAVVAVYIALQQWKTNRSRELREARESKLAVYRRVKLLLRQVLYSPILDPQLYADFRDACAEADFLFKDELRGWLSELADVAAQCMTLQETLVSASPNGDLSSINEMQGELDELTRKLRSAESLLREKFVRQFV